MDDHPTPPPDQPTPPPDQPTPPLDHSTPSPAQPESEPSDSSSESENALTSIYDSGSPPDIDETDEEEKQLGGRMTFLEHLDELRKRILYSLIALIVTSAAGWVFREQIFDVLRAPLGDAVTKLVYTRVTDTFMIWLKVSVAAGVFLASPFILLQIWLFISPGLYRKEKRFAIPFLASGTTLFIVGGLFAYYVILPISLNFLIKELGRSLQPMLTAVDYFGFVVIILLGMGAIFQLPVLVAFFSRFGLITPGFLWRHLRYAVLLIVIIAAVVSPTPDALNLTLWVAPMILLYFGSIGVSWVFQKRRLRTEARSTDS